MRNIVESMIEKLEYFGLTDEANNFKEDVEIELRSNDFPDNQMLWSIIKNIAEILEQYTA